MAESNPSLTVSPEEPLVDDPVQLRATGLSPGEPVVLRAVMEWRGERWEASATFEADADGVVDAGESAPAEGCYDGVRQMGLFQFMDRTGTAETDDRWRADCTVTVERDGTVLDSATVSRWVKRPAVSVTEVDHDSLVGKLYEPPDDGPAAGVVVLGGTEGGIPSDRQSALLASRGYAVLALAYFGAPGLPEELVEVPLEYFETAGAWFTDRESVSDEPLSVVGTSRGADLGLYLGAHLSAVDTVVSYGGSGLMFQGVPEGLYEPNAAFTYGDAEIPYVGYYFSVTYMLRAAVHWVLNRPLALRGIYERGLERTDDGTIEEATIPVEDLGGPVLLVSGSADETRPAETLSDVAERRLREAEYDQPFDHRQYEDAGHAFEVPYLPTTDRDSGREFLPRIPLAFGGTAEGHADADPDAWAAALEYLDRGSGSG